MYEIKNRVSYSQVGMDLKANMAMIAQYFQDCTLFHSEEVGKGIKDVEVNKKAWFLSSWQIEVSRYPEFKEEITIRTWPYDFKSMYGYRNFDILDADGNEIARANSIWIFMDLQKMLPTKLTEQDTAAYGLSPALDMEYTARKIKVLGDEFLVEEYKDTPPVLVKETFLDSNHHVNNGRYITVAMDYVSCKRPVRQMRVDYRKAATLGDYMYPKVLENEECYQITFMDSDGNPFVIVELI